MGRSNRTDLPEVFREPSPGTRRDDGHAEGPDETPGEQADQEAGYEAIVHDVLAFDVLALGAAERRRGRRGAKPTLFGDQPIPATTLAFGRRRPVGKAVGGRQTSSNATTTCGAATSGLDCAARATVALIAM